MTRSRTVSGLGGAAAAGAVVGLIAWASPAQAQMGRTDGSTLFRSYCGSCHGAGAKGDGPLAEHLRVRPPDLTQIAKNKGGTFPADEVRQTIDGRKPLPGHGGGDMPVWGEAFKESGTGQSEAEVQERIDALVQYIQSIQAE